LVLVVVAETLTLVVRVLVGLTKYQMRIYQKGQKV
tara:strand:- start:509 stop:613 length:105 start_codon:yes stop_codon:yes gene_type:complete